MQHLTLNETNLAAEIRGAGHPLLLVHGFPLDHSMWHFQLDEFQRGYRVIAPDLRGFGQSGPAAEISAMEQFADDLISLLDQLQITQPVTLCGLSMGGYIAFAFARKYPQRLARLILCDTRAQADDAAGRQKRHEVAEKVLAEGAGFLAEQMPAKLFAPAFLTSQPEVVNQTQDVIRRTAPASIAAASRGMAARPDVRAELADIAVPTLVLCGTEDAIVPVDEMRHIAAAIPGAEFAEIPGAGHMAPLENPQAVNAVIREFLGKTDV